MSVWPLFEYSIDEFDGVTTAATRQKAVWALFQGYRESVWRIDFGEFLRVLKIKRRVKPLFDDGYGSVRRQYGVNPHIGQRIRLINEGSQPGKEGNVIYPGRSTCMVHVAYDDSPHSVIVHPMNVELLP